jgi:type IV pilus assembly protein PilA
MREQLLERLEDRSEGGFTLIELMVVVLIIAILLAVAIPSFLGARSRAQERASQANVRNALIAEKTYYTTYLTDYPQYTNDITAIQGVEPSLVYVTVPPTQGTKEVQVQIGDATTGMPSPLTANVVCLTSVAGNGAAFSIKEVAAGQNAGTYFSRASIATCNDNITGFTSRW